MQHVAAGTGTGSLPLRVCTECRGRMFLLLTESRSLLLGSCFHKGWSNSTPQITRAQVVPLQVLNAPVQLAGTRGTQHMPPVHAPSRSSAVLVSASLPQRTFCWAFGVWMLRLRQRQLSCCCSQQTLGLAFLGLVSVCLQRQAAGGRHSLQGCKLRCGHLGLVVLLVVLTLVASTAAGNCHEGLALAKQPLHASLVPGTVHRGVTGLVGLVVSGSVGAVALCDGDLAPVLVILTGVAAAATQGCHALTAGPCTADGKGVVVKGGVQDIALVQGGEGAGVAGADGTTGRTLLVEVQQQKHTTAVNKKLQLAGGVENGKRPIFRVCSLGDACQCSLGAVKLALFGSVFPLVITAKLCICMLTEGP